jgi:putative spermidine/putrescine transport system substrate-binding protein
MVTKAKTGPNRRQVVKVMGAGAALIAVPEILVPRKARAAERLVVRNPGGPFEKAFDVALHKPFQQATGVEVVGVTSAHEPVAVVKGMVETKAYQWDVTILSEYTHNTLAKGGFLENLGFENDPVVGEVPANLKAPTIVASYVWSTILAYRTDVYPSKAKAPTGGWKDVWDVKGIPGRRGLRKYPVDTLENAVLADGVAPDKVYPIDIDRAFKSLDKIKKDVAVWWSGGAQSSQLLKTGELDMCVTWNGRAQAVIDEGGPVAISWNQSMWSYDGFAIPKGHPRAELGRKFIRFATEAKNQAAFTPYVAYGPSNPGAMKFVDLARAKLLPTFPEYFSKSIKNNAEYWAGNQEAALDRFNKWMIS